MSRNRMTARAEQEVEHIEAAVGVLEKALKASDDKALESEAAATAKKDMAAVNDSVPAGAADLKDQGDQNAKANDNWPVASKTKVAAQLVKLAQSILDEKDED